MRTLPKTASLVALMALCLADRVDEVKQWLQRLQPDDGVGVTDELDRSCRTIFDAPSILSVEAMRGSSSGHSTYFKMSAA